MFISLNGYYVNRPERRIDASLGIKWVVKGEPWRKKARKFLRDSVATLALPKARMRRATFANKGETDNDL